MSTHSSSVNSAVIFIQTVFQQYFSNILIVLLNLNDRHGPNSNNVSFLSGHICLIIGILDLLIR